MKSIFSTRTFTLIFFLFSLFSLPFFLRPAPALAAGQQCCSSGLIYIEKPPPGIQPGCFTKVGATGYIALDRKGNSACAGTERCDSNTCVQATKPPTCQPVGVVKPGFYNEPICQQEFTGQCCKGAFTLPVGGNITGGYCEAKNGSHIGFVDLKNDCSLKNQIVLSPETYCGSDGTFSYDPKTGLCVQGFESTWEIKNSCDNQPPGTGVQTAIGCVPTNDLKGFLEFVLKWAFFASGGIIVLMVIATGYTLLTSQGNPEKLQAAKENIVALFSGLILIAFSLVLLQTIGADILKLPTF